MILILVSLSQLRPYTWDSGDAGSSQDSIYKTRRNTVRDGEDNKII